MDSKDAKVAVEGAAKNNKAKKIIGTVVGLIIIFNIFWNLMEHKISEELGGGNIAALDERIAVLEKSNKETLDVDAVKADLAAMKEASDKFESKLNAIVKAEEAKLDVLTQNVESQKAYVETLKSLLSGETGK
ncbi:hypothetical protein FACS1894187_16740 [Synergistales bacterium]|nr:hypothetical protein FACS1894187_16740 [Synergistales bacterium]